MFSTFTGNSRRPRNVNLSGQAGNPFANTSWSPSAASNANKTVSNAQAEREKRQADRQRLKAAGHIQRTWRGHKTRKMVRDAHRTTFDALYSSTNTLDATQRLPRSFALLLSFFHAKCNEDLGRLSQYILDSESVELRDIISNDLHDSRVQRLVSVLVRALNRCISEDEVAAETRQYLAYVTRIVSWLPQIVAPSVPAYYSMLAKLCQFRLGADWVPVVKSALAAPLASNDKRDSRAYEAYAFSFLSCKNMHFFEDNVSTLSEPLYLPNLMSAVDGGVSSASLTRLTRNDLLWLLAHFIDIGRASPDINASKLYYLQIVYTLLSILAPDISVRIGLKTLEDEDDSSKESMLQPLDPYISRLLTSLVEPEGISMLLHDFSANLVESSSKELEDASLLAGYILTLLRCFPANGDGIRMRLFLEQIPAASGEIPTVKFLWHIMSQTTVFFKLVTGMESHIDVLRKYLCNSVDNSGDSGESQDWRIILLFLDLYVFVLRLSDDEDFFSGIYPEILNQDSATSRLRSCSLPLVDVKALTVFLKNTAFTLHYNAHELSRSQKSAGTVPGPRLESYFTSFAPNRDSQADTTKFPASTGARLGLENLRTIVTVAMKMVYERDSRKPFLPRDHWLMHERLEREDFVGAVIAEEERQNQEDTDGSDDDMDSDTEEPYGNEPGYYVTMAGQRLSRHARLERLKAQQMRAQKERRLAELGPKLEILKHMPFVVPFETRVMIFRQFIQLDRARRDGNTQFIHPFARHHAEIRRGHLFDDAFAQFYRIGDGIKDAIQITFVDQFGTPEAGIDGGGVTKEFLISVTSEAFGGQNDGVGMFTANRQGLLYPDPAAVDIFRDSLRQSGVDESDPSWKKLIIHSDLVMRYEFLGRVVGKCLYEGILVDLAFAGFFLLKWASTGPNDKSSYKGSVNDLRDMDEELYSGMLRLKNYPGDVSELGLDFTIEDQVSKPGEPVKTVTRKLIANGDQVPVTNDNRLLYISYVARHRLVVQPALQTTAFLRGLRAVIRPSWLSMFNQSELQRLVGGDSSEIDLEDLRRNTIYSGLYEIGDDGQEHDTIKMFWKVMTGFTDSQRRDVLKYVSSTPRAPLLGFSQLRPKFSIRDGGADEDRLPSTSTCVNLLKLPRYTTEEALREKLLYAITSGAGFDLS